MFSMAIPHTAFLFYVLLFKMCSEIAVAVISELSCLWDKHLGLFADREQVDLLLTIAWVFFQWELNLGIYMFCLFFPSKLYVDTNPYSL